MGRWHVRHQLGTSWCLLRGGCQRKQELWLHGEAWHRQFILWLDCQVFFSTAHACPWYASILMPWHEPGTGGSPQPCRRLRFAGVFLRAEGVIKMSCRRDGRWNEDDLKESSVSDLLRNVTCKPLLFVFFCQVALIYLYINMLKPIAGRISIWMEIIEIDWNFLEQSLRGGASRIQQAVGLPGDHWNHQDWWVPWPLDWHSDLALCSSHPSSPLWPWPMVRVGWQMGHSSQDLESEILQSSNSGALGLWFMSQIFEEVTVKCCCQILDHQMRMTLAAALDLKIGHPHVSEGHRGKKHMWLFWF